MHPAFGKFRDEYAHGQLDTVTCQTVRTMNTLLSASYRTPIQPKDMDGLTATIKSKELGVQLAQSKLREAALRKSINNYKKGQPLVDPQELRDQEEAEQHACRPQMTTTGSNEDQPGAGGNEGHRAYVVRRCLTEYFQNYAPSTHVIFDVSKSSIVSALAHFKAACLKSALSCFELHATNSTDSLEVLIYSLHTCCRDQRVCMMAAGPCAISTSTRSWKSPLLKVALLCLMVGHKVLICSMSCIQIRRSYFETTWLEGHAQLK